MLELDQAVAEWRSEFSAHGGCSVDELDELESHLREIITAEVDAGLSVEEAFAAAVARIGAPEVVCDEFANSGAVGKLDSAVLKCHTIVVGLLSCGCLWMGCNYTIQRGDPVLAAHVALITFGYTSLLLLGIVGSYAVLRAAMKKETLEWSKALGQHLSWHLVLAMLPCVAGTLLGGWWWETQTGDFWGGSFRENGALMVFVATLSSWLIVKQSFLRGSQLGQLCLLLCVVAEVAWFGPLIVKGSLSTFLVVSGCSILILQLLLGILPLLWLHGSTAEASNS